MLAYPCGAACGQDCGIGCRVADPHPRQAIRRNQLASSQKLSAPQRDLSVCQSKDNARQRLQSNDVKERTRQTRGCMGSVQDAEHTNLEAKPDRDAALMLGTGMMLRAISSHACIIRSGRPCRSGYSFNEPYRLRWRRERLWAGRINASQ
jgi:hypothetical protein